MKITKQRLKQIIKEELGMLETHEGDASWDPAAAEGEPRPGSQDLPAHLDELQRSVESNADSINQILAALNNAGILT